MPGAGERKVVEMRNGKRKIKSTGDKYQEGDTDWQGVQGSRGGKGAECSQLKCKCKSKSSLVQKRKETAPGKLAAQTTKWLLH